MGRWEEGVGDMGKWDGKVLSRGKSKMNGEGWGGLKNEEEEEEEQEEGGRRREEDGDLEKHTYTQIQVGFICIQLLDKLS